MRLTFFSTDKYPQIILLACEYYILNYTLQFTAPSVKGWYKQNSSSLWLAATVVAQGSGAIGTDDLIVTIPITGSVNFKVTAVNPSIGTVVSSNVITQTIT